MSFRACLVCVIAGFAFGWAASAVAAPWTATDDAGLRSDIENLVDADVITIPVMTWPVNWVNLRSSVDASKLSNASYSVNQSYQRVSRVMHAEMDGGIAAEVSAQLANEEQAFRPFGAAAVDKSRASGTLKWLGDRFAAELHGAARGSPSDDDSLVMDGSYFAGIFGNWIVSAGKEPRWWGPGWRNSLILGTNARPMTALSLRRNNSERSDWSGFKWLGPWSFETLMARFDNDPVFDRPLLWGMRFSFMPRNDFEFALSRTAEWGGDGRSTGFADFGKIVFGRDNDGAIGQQVSNQLAGFDFRWRSPIGNAGYAIYAQAIGEDEAHLMPSKYIGLMGAEVFDWRWLTDRSMRVYVEIEDTEAGLLYTNPRRPNVAYEHSVYTAGYRYYRRSLGSSLDNDALSYSVGGLLYANRNQSWQANVSWMDLNRDDGDSLPPGGNSLNIGRNQLTLIEVETQFQSRAGVWALGGSVQSKALNASVYNGQRFRLYVSWTMR